MNDKPLRVLVFAPAFAPLGNPEAIVNGKLVLAMRSFGWHVDVICRQLLGTVPYDYGSDWVEPWTELRGVVHGVPYRMERTLRTRLQIVRAAILTGHLFGGVSPVPEELRLGMALHRRHRYDLILSRALPNIAHLPAMTMTRRTGVPWIANWNDPLDDRHPGNGGKKNVVRDAAALRLARAVWRAASVVTYPSARMRDYTARCYGDETRSKTEIIPHVGLVNRPAATPFRGTSFTLCHTGSLVGPRRGDVLLRALSRLSRQAEPRDNFRLKLIGLVDPSMLDLSRELGIAQNVECLGKKSYLESLRELQQCDVQVVIEASCKEGIFLPSKFVDCVQTGRPVLAISPRIGTLNDMLSQHGGGIAADIDDENSVFHAISTLYDCWKKNCLHETYGSRDLYSLFSPEKIVSQYADIYRTISRKVASRN